MEKWEQSGWAKKLAARQVRKVSVTRRLLLWWDERRRLMDRRTRPTLTGFRSSWLRSRAGISFVRHTFWRKRRWREGHGTTSVVCE